MRLFAQLNPEIRATPEPMRTDGAGTRSKRHRAPGARPARAALPMQATRPVHRRVAPAEGAAAEGGVALGMAMR